MEATGRDSADRRNIGWTGGSVEPLKQSCQWVRSTVAVSHQVSEAPPGDGSSTCGQPVSVLHHLPPRKLLQMSSLRFSLRPLLSHLSLQGGLWLCHLCNCLSSSCGLFPDASSAAALLESTKSARPASAHMCSGHIGSFVLDRHQHLTSIMGSGGNMAEDMKLSVISQVWAHWCQVDGI